MSDITGARGTGNIASSIRKVDMREAVLELEPSSAPLTVLTNRLNKAPTVNPEFSWVEDDLEPRFDAVNNGAGYNSSATSIVVDNGAYFAQHDLVKVTRTGEIIRVVTITSNTLSDVVRGVGGGAAAIVDNDELLIIGSAQPEGDTSKPARSSNPAKVTNYTQIHRTPVESTETLRHSDTITRPNDWNRQRNHAGIEHNIKWEEILLHGKPSEDLTGSQPRRTTGGVFNFVQTNRNDVGGTMTEAEFWATFNTGFRYGSQTKLGLFSRRVIDVVNGYPRGKLEVLNNDPGTTYGIEFMKFRSPLGNLNIVVHNLLEGAVYGGYGVVLDPEQLRIRPLANEEGSRDTHIRENIQAPDADTRKDEYLTERGLEFGLEKTHFIISNVTG